ncbi:hypothetical protein ACFSUK_27275 [Sphingobium scionense]
MTNDAAMTPERFAALADAYGADLRRWPSHEQDAAQAMLATDPANARDVLARAATLDGLLDRHRVPAPSSALIGHPVIRATARPALVAREAVVVRAWSGGHRACRRRDRRARLVAGDAGAARSSQHRTGGGTDHLRRSRP